MSNKIRVLIKEPGKDAVVDWIEPTLEIFRALVGGHIKSLSFRRNVCCYIDDDGKLKGKESNFRWSYGDMVLGTAVFFGRGYDGEEISLTDEQLFYLDIDLSLKELLSVTFSEIKRR